MKPFAKQNRSAIACTLCRSSKVRCLRGTDSATCKRCTKLEQRCLYEIKESQKSGLIKQKVLKSLNRGRKQSHDRLSQAAAAQPVMPPKHQVLELMEIFFTNQYQGIFPFLHKPSVLEFMNSDSFNPETYIEDYHEKYSSESPSDNLRYLDPILLLAIMALCARLHKPICRSYGGFLDDQSPESFQPGYRTSNEDESDLVSASNASKYFGYHARKLMKGVFDTPRLLYIQAFTLLSSHEWGEGKNARSFLYVSIAARMALILGLANESPLDSALPDHITQIVLESRRRTVWCVYMMDRCHTSGRERVPSIRIDDIKVKLPTHENDFLLGKPNCSSFYNDAIVEMGDPDSGFGSDHKISIVGFTIIMFEIWAKIAKWVGEVGAKYEKIPPWKSESTFRALTQDLTLLEKLLPLDLKFTEYNLRTHFEQDTANHFGYFHNFLFICHIFLKREYLYSNPKSCPPNWWGNQVVALLDYIEKLTHLTERLVFNKVMVMAPFTGFKVFTGIVTCFYFCSFQNQILLENLEIGRTVADVELWKYKYKTLAIKNMESLNLWSQSWELGRNWKRLAVHLGIIFGQLAENRTDEINSDSLRHSMHDFGSGEVTESTLKPKRGKNDKKLLMLSNDDSDSAATLTPEAICDIDEESIGLRKRGDIEEDIEDYVISEAPRSQLEESDFLNAIELISIPQVPFKLDSTSIFPGWDECIFLDQIDEK